LTKSAAPVAKGREMIPGKSGRVITVDGTNDLFATFRDYLAAAPVADGIVAALG
jgi:hypothetical protein